MPVTRLYLGRARSGPSEACNQTTVEYLLTLRLAALLLSFPSLPSFLFVFVVDPLHSFYLSLLPARLQLSPPFSPALNFLSVPNSSKMPAFKSILASVALMALAFSPIAAASSGKSKFLSPFAPSFGAGISARPKVERRVHSRVERA